MKDTEIIKALECCLADECDECPFQDDSPCKEYLNYAALDLINRLKQENESLKRENALLKDSWKLIEYDPLLDSHSFIPDPCKNCSNHPSNGGSGICNCTLGGEPIIC